MTRWAMVADLERCVGCQTCTAACRHANATSPAVQWRKVLDIEAGSYPHVSRTFVPVGCQHCADPPCMHVCPSTATRRRPDGIVTIDYDICIGCAYCDVACPYQARFKIDASRFAYGAIAIENEIERADPHLIGVAQKCTFCVDRIDFGLADGLTPGSDPRATPACVNACIADALHFGDLDDPDSNVSRLLREQQSFRMHEELGTQPGYYYLYGHAADGSEHEDVQPAAAAVPPHEVGTLRAKGAEPTHQQHWDWKAAGNFICGGAGAGLFVLATIAGLRDPAPFWLGWVALALVALGLLLVLLKIGRPWRCVSVLRQPQRSWMSREAWVALGLFPLAMVGTWLEARLVLLAAAIFAIAFLVSQAMILKEARGIPAWRTWAIVPLIIVTGLAEGAGLLLAAVAPWSSWSALATTTALAAVALIVLRAWSWHSYVTALEIAGAPRRALEALDAFRPWFSSLGLLLPCALIGSALLLPATARLMFALAGIVIFAAGGAMKYVIVTRAGYNQGFALAHTPVRGRGRPGPAVKLGWSRL